MAYNHLTDKEYWGGQISQFLPIEVIGNQFEPILKRYLPVNSSFTCTEIGAYPGHFLCYMAKAFKYAPTAIEYRDDVEDIKKLFEYNGLSGLNIINDDFLNIKGLQFDIVTSFGFIEHFTDYVTVIKRHVDMLKPRGYLVISVPHFWGLQGVLRRLIFKREALAEIYATHNFKIMNLAELKKHLKNSGLDILFSDYVMGCSFWISADSPKIKPERRWLAEILEKLEKKLLPKLPSLNVYSPMILCIARKN